jgi:molybdopterin-guanine dinucleotide biosynthesis protein MobB
MLNSPLERPLGPALAVCGWSGSGKTTALREVIPRLTARGLAVAALKHDAHGIQVDPKGKDSDTLFEAGADVVLRGPGQSLIRTRAAHPASTGELPAALARLLLRYDLVLVEGHKSTPLPKVWIAGEGETEPPAGVTHVIATLARSNDRSESLLRLIEEWLPRAWRSPPLLGGVLVGGASRRMGKPKALLEYHGKTFLERTVETLSRHAREVVILGEGEVSESCADLPRLPDPPGLTGPLAGILGALRWAPGATWIVTACDQPLITDDSIAWLLDQRAPGTWTVLPRVGSKGVEPLLAVYDARARPVLESLASSGCLAPSKLAEHERTASPVPPEELALAWRNVNTPADLETLPEAPRPRRRSQR